jgi:putative endonuclease
VAGRPADLARAVPGDDMKKVSTHPPSDCQSPPPPATRNGRPPTAAHRARGGPASDAPFPSATARAAAAARASGAWGEREAERFLSAQRGFSILARNWRSPHDRRDEIDLIARDGEVLVFIEVKTRAAGARVPGYFSIGGAKKAALRRAARAYLAGHGAGIRTFRLDVVEVTGAPSPDPGGAAPAGADPSEILHFENIPLFARNALGTMPLPKDG